jgi:hypothetical protein
MNVDVQTERGSNVKNNITHNNLDEKHDEK